MNQNIVNALIAAGALYAAYKWGSQEIKVMALGAAGAYLARQLPVVSTGYNAPLFAATAAAA